MPHALQVLVAAKVLIGLLVIVEVVAFICAIILRFYVRGNSNLYDNFDEANIQVRLLKQPVHFERDDIRY